MLETVAIGTATGAVYGLLAIGITLIYRGSRVLNLAHGEIGTFGLFAVWALIDRGVGWWPAAAAGIGLGIGVGMVFAAVVVRNIPTDSQLTLAVASSGLLTLLVGLEIVLFGGEPRFLPSPFEGTGIHLGSFVMTRPHIAAIATLLVISLCLAWVTRSTKLGIAFSAVSDDPLTSSLMGIPMQRISILCWGAGAGLAVVAALLVEPLIGIFYPYSITVLVVRAFAAALIGGLRSMTAAAIGGVAIGVTEAAISDIAIGVPGLPDIAMLGVVLLVLLLRPRGLAGSAA